MLVEYRRGGGYPPVDDEMLSVEDDGSFVLLHTVGGPRVGRFAGTVSRQALTGLVKLVERVTDLTVPPEGLPPNVIETVTTARARLSVAAHTNPGAQAAKILRRLRELSDELTAQPVAALEMEVDAAGRSITVRSVGRESVDVGLGAAELGYTLFGEREEFIGSHAIALPPELRLRDQLAPGWSRELPLPDALDFTPKRTLDVKLDFDLFDSARPVRRARLAVITGKGWGR